MPSHIVHVQPAKYTQGRALFFYNSRVYYIQLISQSNSFNSECCFVPEN